MKQRCKQQKEYKVLEPETINNAYRYQKDNLGWTFFNEREYAERVFQSRFNFLAVFYALFVTVFFRVNTIDDKKIILIIGSIFTLLISLSVYRSHVKLMLLLKVLNTVDAMNPLNVLEPELKERGILPMFKVNYILGAVIPLLMVLTCIIALTLMLAGIWPVIA